jgi:hypothetical protein
MPTVSSEMLRDLAAHRAMLLPAIQAAISCSRDGPPRAQLKMAARIRQAGAIYVDLKPGKRGRYEIDIYEWTGWDPIANSEIKVGDAIPSDHGSPGGLQACTARVATDSRNVLHRFCLSRTTSSAARRSASGCARPRVIEPISEAPDGLGGHGTQMIAIQPWNLASRLGVSAASGRPPRRRRA